MAEAAFQQKVKVTRCCRDEKAIGKSQIRKMTELLEHSDKAVAIKNLPADHCFKYLSSLAHFNLVVFSDRF